MAKKGWPAWISVSILQNSEVGEIPSDQVIMAPSARSSSSAPKTQKFSWLTLSDSANRVQQWASPDSGQDRTSTVFPGLENGNLSKSQTNPIATISNRFHLLWHFLLITGSCLKYYTKKPKTDSVTECCDPLVIPALGKVWRTWFLCITDCHCSIAAACSSLCFW